MDLRRTTGFRSDEGRTSCIKPTMGWSTLPFEKKLCPTLSDVSIVLVAVVKDIVVMILSYVVSEPGGSGPGLKNSSLSFILKYCAIANCMAIQFSHSPSWRRVLLFCVLLLRNRVGVKSERSTKQKNCDTGNRGSPGSDCRLAPKLSGCTCVWLMANSESHGH